MTKRPTPRRRWKRRAAVWVVICAVLGLVTTVGVAWCGAWRGADALGWTGQFFEGQLYIRVDATSSWYAVVRRQIEELPRENGRRAPLESQHVVDQADGLHHRKEIWGRIRTDGSARVESIEHVSADRMPTSNRLAQRSTTYEEQAAGWPRLALWEFRILQHAGTGPRKANWVERGAWVFNAGPGIPRAKTTRLPYLPIWRGLLIDTAFWGAVWFVLLWPMGLATGRLKRSRRARHGKCVWCKYDLRGIENTHCPECGRQDPVRTVE